MQRSHFRHLRSFREQNPAPSCLEIPLAQSHAQTTNSPSSLCIRSLFIHWYQILMESFTKSSIPHLLTHSAQLKHVDQPKNTFCTPEQSCVAALRSHYGSHIWKSPDWESGPNLPLLWITKHQEASASTSSFLPKGKSSTALLSLKSIRVPKAQKQKSSSAEIPLKS